MVRTIIFSLGGSLIMPKDIDTDFLKRFRDVVLSYDDIKFVLVCGGGHVAREYMLAAESLGNESDEDGDWIGIMGTRMNAELVRVLFGEDAHSPVEFDPTRKFDTDKKVIVGAGWKPGCSSDMDAVLFAENVAGDMVVNLSNIAYVYDKDPSKHDDAVKKEKMTWDELLEITGKEWKPGLNVPFDPTAAQKAKELGLKVVIADGKNFDNLKKIIEGKDFEGTTIE